MEIHHYHHIQADYWYSNTYITISNRVLNVRICLNKLLAHGLIFVWGWISSVLDHTSGKSSNDLDTRSLGQHTTSYRLFGTVGVFTWNIKGIDPATSRMNIWSRNLQKNIAINQQSGVRFGSVMVLFSSLETQMKRKAYKPLHYVPQLYSISLIVICLQDCPSIMFDA